MGSSGYWVWGSPKNYALPCFLSPCQCNKSLYWCISRCEIRQLLATKGLATSLEVRVLRAPPPAAGWGAQIAHNSLGRVSVHLRMAASHTHLCEIINSKTLEFLHMVFKFQILLLFIYLCRLRFEEPIGGGGPINRLMISLRHLTLLHHSLSAFQYKQYSPVQRERTELKKMPTRLWVIPMVIPFFEIFLLVAYKHNIYEFSMLYTNSTWFHSVPQFIFLHVPLLRERFQLPWHFLGQSDKTVYSLNLPQSIRLHLLFFGNSNIKYALSCKIPLGYGFAVGRVLSTFIKINVHGRPPKSAPARYKHQMNTFWPLTHTLKNFKHFCSFDHISHHRQVDFPFF